MEPFYPFIAPLRQHSNNRVGLVSIITRTKNRPGLLRRALASASRQTYSQWEHIIVNDGGARDEVEAVLAGLDQEQVGKTRVIHLPQSIGMEGASNAGLSTATGEFFVIHDDDDTWHADFLAGAVDFLRAPRNECLVAVATNCEIVLEEEDADGTYRTTDRKAWNLWSKQIQLQDLLTRNTIPTISLLIRRDVLQHLKGYAEKMPVLGDWDFNIRLLLLGDIGTIDRKLAYYHQRTTQADATSNSVSGGLEKHHEYWRKYRNSLTRRTLSENPATIGLLNPVLTKIDELRQQQAHELTRIQTSLEGLHQAIQRLEIFLNASAQESRAHLRDEAREIRHLIQEAPRPMNSIQHIMMKIRRLIGR